MAQKEVIIGALFLLIPFVGWILNMGHRIAMTNKMQHGEEAWPSWNNFRVLFRHGILTFLGMLEYHSPAILSLLLWYFYEKTWMLIAGVSLWIPATIAVPGYMTHYCYSLNPREIFNPFLALKRVFEGGKDYWIAWSIVLVCLIFSFSGLFVFGIGFLITSVWFWQSAGFSFAIVFTKKYKLLSQQASVPNARPCCARD